MKRILLLWLSFFAVFSGLEAQQSDMARSSRILVVSGQDQFDLIPYVEVMPDPTESLEPEKVLSGELDAHFIKTLKGIALEDLHVRGVYWFRFSISNNMGRNLRIEVSAPVAQLFYLDDQETGRRIDGLADLSSDLDFVGAKLPSQSFSVFNAPRNTTYYLRISIPEIKASQLDLNLSVERRERAFLRDAQVEFYFYLGVLLAFFLYNLAVFFLVRKSSNVYFLLYLVSFMVSMIMSFTEQGRFLSWDDFLWMSRFRYTTFNFIFIFLSLFSIRHMRFREQFKRGRLLLLGISGIMFLDVIIAWIMPEVITFLKHSVFLASLALIVMIIGAIRVIRKFKYARFVLLSFFFTAFFYVILVLEFFRFLNPPFSPFYAMGVFEVFFFSLSIADRINMERSARSRLLEKQNITLENKVRERTREINEEKEKSEKLLLNILPEETAKELRENGMAAPRLYPAVTVIFTDFKDFTSIAEKMPPESLVEEIDTCFREFDQIMEKYEVEKIKTIGDAYMAAAGLPLERADHAERSLKAAHEIIQFMTRYKAQRIREGRPYFEIRIGIHSGPVVAGVVGTHKFQYDIWGDTVNLAARMEQSGEAGKINISERTKVLLGELEGIHLEDRGALPVKNKGHIEMYFAYLEENLPENNTE